jgi:hypothetical protein
MKRLKAGTTIAATGILVACASQMHSGKAADAAPRIAEINITNDPNISSGEPEIAVDPTNPRNLSIVEFAVGSAKVPAYSKNPVIEPASIEEADAAMANNGRVWLSRDGGKTWKVRPAPAYSLENSPGGGDPMIAYGPDGTLYVADEPFAKNPRERGDLSRYAFVIAASTDGGKTFGLPQRVLTPVDRPWLKVDQSTGVVYTASTGPLNPATGERNRPGPGAIMDRWLTVWQPHLSAHSEPRRMGGPDFSAANASTMTVANGVIASLIVLGGPEPGGNRAVPIPVPTSLQGVVRDGTTMCSLDAPCLFLQTSGDQGRTWTRHQVPVPGGFRPRGPDDQMDVGRRPNRAGTKLLVLLTEDSGATWSGPYTVPEMAEGVNFKQWMDYGPTGVLGYVWKKQRSDLTAATPSSVQPQLGRAWGPGFDVYTAISCDGGKTWTAPLRVNAESSPPGPNGFDDFSYLALDDRNAHVVWGDRRNFTKVTNAPTGIGGVQVYYARVPFSAMSGGAICGRR